MDMDNLWWGIKNVLDDMKHILIFLSVLAFLIGSILYYEHNHIDIYIDGRPARLVEECVEGHWLYYTIDNRMESIYICDKNAVVDTVYLKP